jgi:hypothetical protein
MVVLAVFTLSGNLDGTVAYLQQQGIPLGCQSATWLLGSFILVFFRKYEWSFLVGTLPLALFLIVTLAVCIAQEQWSVRPILYCLLLYILNREHYDYGL